MKRTWIVLLVLTGLTVNRSEVSATPSAAGGVSIHFSASFGHAGMFYESLRPYGEWIEFDRGFYVWRPLRVRTGWRPYMYGRWVWTDYGWYWVSSEPFGWAVFHYGRWFYDDYYGWIWIPDRVWGPAWVEWRYNNDYIGWAPLPPYASFSISVGIRFTTRWYSPPHYWSFVRYRHFASPHLVREVVPIEHTRRLISTTRSAGRYEVDGNRIINRGVDRSFVERRGYTRIERVEVRDGMSRGERFVRDQSRERIEVYRPSRSELERMPDRIEARRPERRSSLELDRIERPQRERTDQIERGRDGEERRIDREEFRSRTPEPTDRQLRGREESDEQRQESGSRELTLPRFPERRESVRRDAEPRYDGRSPNERRKQTESAPDRSPSFRERIPREERKEYTPPRQRTETPRAAPERRASPSPRGSEQGRRDGKRGRE